jgi:hypothetical protein
VEVAELREGRRAQTWLSPRVAASPGVVVMREGRRARAWLKSARGGERGRGCSPRRALIAKAVKVRSKRC